jgi:hypothetical protein
MTPSSSPWRSDPAPESKVSTPAHGGAPRTHPGRLNVQNYAQISQLVPRVQHFEQLRAEGRPRSAVRPQSASWKSPEEAYATAQRQRDEWKVRSPCHIVMVCFL